MKKLSLIYEFRYTTSGEAHRYTTSKNAKENIGDIYLRGISTPPSKLKISVESI